MHALFTTNRSFNQAKNPCEFYITLRIEKNNNFVFLVIYQQRIMWILFVYDHKFFISKQSCFVEATQVDNRTVICFLSNYLP